MSTENLYETDFAAWAMEQAARLRAGKPVDVENIAEESESLGRSEPKELVSHLAVTLTHMLQRDHLRKWTRSRRDSMAISRHHALRTLRHNPASNHR